MSNNIQNLNLISVIGYGTFITRGHWKDKKNVEVCLVKNYRRIFPKENWFPYVLYLEGASFWALKFSVNEEQLKELDYYEGVSAGLFERIQTDIVLKDKKRSKAFIYIPTEKTIKSQNLILELDKKDRWTEEIKKYPEIVKKYPELV